MNLNIDPTLLLNQNASPVGESRKINRENPEELHRVCREFEAIFIRNLFKNMRATIPDSGLLEKNIDREIIEDMMDMETAKKMAMKNELGIAEMLFKQLYQPSPAKPAATTTSPTQKAP